MSLRELSPRTPADARGRGGNGAPMLPAHHRLSLALSELETQGGTYALAHALDRARADVRAQIAAGDVQGAVAGTAVAHPDVRGAWS